MIGARGLFGSFQPADSSLALLAGKDVGYVLTRSTTPITAPADTNEDTLATIPIPAGAIGANGIFVITTAFSCTSSANAKTLRIRLGGAAGTIMAAISSVNTIVAITSHIAIMNRNAQDSQISLGAAVSAGGGGFGYNAVAFPTASINMAIAQDLVVTGQKASAGELLRLDAYFVEIFPKA